MPWLVDNEPYFRKVRAARLARYCEFGVPFSDPVGPAEVKQRALMDAMILSDWEFSWIVVQVSFALGDHGLLVEQWRRERYENGIAVQQMPLLGAELPQFLTEIAPHLQIVEGPDLTVSDPGLPTGPATVGQVKGLIAELAGPAAEARWRQQFQLSLAITAVTSNEIIEGRHSPRWPASSAAWKRLLLGPKERLEHFSTPMLIQLVLASRPGARPPMDAAKSALFRIGCVRNARATEARRRLAATLLAVRLFEVRHGRVPTRLEELVPEFLPSVPMEPLAEPGVAIRWERISETEWAASTAPMLPADFGLPEESLVEPRLTARLLTERFQVVSGRPIRFRPPIPFVEVPEEIED